MNHAVVFLVLGLVFLGLLMLAFLVWAIWVRPFVKRAGARTASPYSLVALVADFSTSLIYNRGPMPWFLRFFAVLLILLASDLVLAVLLVLFGF